MLLCFLRRVCNKIWHQIRWGGVPRYIDLHKLFWSMGFVGVCKGGGG